MRVPCLRVHSCRVVRCSSRAMFSRGQTCAQQRQAEPSVLWEPRPGCGKQVTGSRQILDGLPWQLLGPLATWGLDSLAVARRALLGPAYRAPRLGPIHRPARGARFRVFDFPGRSRFPGPIRGCSRCNAQQADRVARGQCREHELAARWPAAKPRLLHVGSGCLDRGALVCG